MERIDAGQPFGVVVDYAHTADSLAKVLRTLRPLTTGRLIVVFGSAGERDRVKRPEMGRVAAELADIAIVTDEDPRLEDPRAINEAIADGARAAGARDGETLWVIDDRRAAIAHAIGLARPGDMLLLAGKGHEGSIIYGTTKAWWDEREVARRGARRSRLQGRCLSSPPSASPTATPGTPSSSTPRTGASRSSGSGASCASPPAGARSASRWGSAPTSRSPAPRC